MHVSRRDGSSKSFSEHSRAVVQRENVQNFKIDAVFENHIGEHNLVTEGKGHGAAV